MRKYLKQGIALMLSLVLVLALSACGGKTGNEDKIVIAYIGPLTGGSAIYGIVESDTVQMLVEETNENGGLLGKQLELKIYDNRDDAVETTNAARKAIQNDGVVAFIGPDASTTAIALDEVCKEYGIPHITTCGTNYKVTQREEDGSVREYYVEMTHQAKIRGNIYKGVINNIDTNLQAAFVNYGNVKNGFLQIDEVHPEYYLQPHEPTKGRKYPPIQKVLKPGQEVLVQVVKEPNGSKGAFLTTWLSLAGRFLVLTPGQEQIGISRKVEDGEERNRLRELIRGLEPGEGLGAIVRTVSAGTSKTTLQKDLSFLKRVWKDIRKRATTEKVPSLIYQEPGLASRSVRDYLSDDVSEVWVDNAETAEAIREMASLLFPRKGDLVHLYEKHDKTLWEHFGLLNQIEQVHSREVLMPSGGRLVFDQTEALMAIDINSGKIGGKTNFEAMAFRTNMEAATAIARQLRLRDIGGQIVIDFIEMRDPEHCREVEKELRNAMKGDRARHDIGKMSSFGLLQIVRQRTGSSAISISMETCPHCKGTGQRRNMEWQSVQTLRDLHRAMRSAAAAGQTEYAHSVDAELGLYLLNHKRERLSLMEKEFHIRLDIRIEGISSAPAAPAQQQGHQHNGQNNGR